MHEAESILKRALGIAALAFALVMWLAAAVVLGLLLIPAHIQDRKKKAAVTF